MFDAQDFLWKLSFLLIPGIFAITLHEVSHGWVAKQRLADATPDDAVPSRNSAAGEDAIVGGLENLKQLRLDGAVIQSSRKRAPQHIPVEARLFAGAQPQTGFQNGLVRNVSIHAIVLFMSRRAALEALVEAGPESLFQHRPAFLGLPADRLLKASE